MAKRDQGLQRGTAGGRRAEEALRESEERLRLVVSNAPIILFAVDRHGIFTLSEGNGLEALGLKPGEAVGLSAFEMFQDIADVGENLRRALAGEAFTKTVDLAGLTFETHCAPLRGRNGQISGLIGVAIDINERKRMEEALRESDEKFHRIFDNAYDIYYRTDAQGIITDISPSVERFGYTPEELIGRQVLDIYENPEERSALLKALFESGVVVDYEVHLKTGDGRVSTASVSSHLLRGPDGAFAGVEGSLRDITERKQAAQALARQSALVRAMNRVFAEALTSESEEAVARTCLAVAEQLTGSKFGFIGEVNQAGHFDTFALSDPGWQACRMPNSDAVAAIRDMEIRGIWGSVIKEGRSLIANDPASHPDRVGTPEGHPPITAFLGTPLKRGGKNIGMIAVANKEAGYNLADQKDLETLSAAFVEALERKRAEQALRESEEAYRELFDNANDIVYTHDLTGRFTSINRAAERVFGYTLDEALQENIARIVAPEDLEMAREMILRKARGEPVTTYELETITKDGRRVPVEVSTRLIYKDGKPVGVQGIARDISERKRAEEALRESEEKFRGIFENVQDIYYRTDAQGMIIEISPSVERWGYTREGLIGTQVLDVYEDPEERSELLKVLFERGEVADYEVRLKTGDGRVIPTSVSTRLLRGPDGSPIGVEGSLRDISERKRMEKELRESEERYRTLVETSPDAIMLTDRSGNIIMANRQATLLLGFESAEEMLLMSKSITDFVSPEDRERAIHNAHRTVEMGTLKNIEYTLLRKDGSRFPGEVNASLTLDAEGNPIAFIAVVRDITERKRVEEALREQVRRDPLTGTLNHAAIVEELRSLISSGAEGSPHAVAMIDVNDLKVVNDTFGHQVGDEVLVIVADALAGGGVLVGRYGGDEFVAILPGADREAAESYRQEVLASLEDVELRDPDTEARVPVAVSVGFAIYPAEAERIEDLIKLADSAMYAWRRQRPVLSTVRALSRSLDGDRAAKMVGEIVPLLTSSGDVNDKLRLVAHRLSVGAGYDAVNFALLRPGPDEPYSLNTFAELPEQTIEAWNHEQHKNGWDSNPMRLLAERGRPVILDNPQRDKRLTAVERELLRAAGMQSAMVAPMLWRNELVGLLSVASKQKAAFGPRDAQFLMAVAAQVTGIVRMATLVGELQSTSTRLAQAQTETVMMLAAAAEAHDQATGLHLQNVRAITKTLARELGYRQEDAEELGLAAVLHDIGKVRVPDVVLSTAGQLTDPEWELMKQHTVWGGDFLAGRPGFELAATIARSHHERWDGGGYPDGLVDDTIPKAATIVAVADAFDAMTSDRPYRGARSVAAAVREIVACSGGQFSPSVVQALVRLHKRKRLPRLRREGLGKLAA